MKDLAELREMSKEDLDQEILNLRKEQFSLRLAKASGSLDKTHKITSVRKSIARIKTILTEKAGA